MTLDSRDVKAWKVFPGDDAPGYRCEIKAYSNASGHSKRVGSQAMKSEASTLNRSASFLI
jgi:hypothetical protein